MADIFLRDNVRSLIDSKYVLIFGGSNLRALYKDFLTIYHSNRLITDAELRRKLEPSFLEDSLVQAVGLTRGRHFKEHRVFAIDETVIEYFFITKCFCPDIVNTLNEVRTEERRTPDVLVMNSTLWDVTRWGSQGVKLFKDNMRKLVAEFKKCLPPSTLVIWLTAPPLSQVQQGVLIEQVEFLKHTLRFDAMEANCFAHKLIAAHEYDVLDFHYYLKLSVHRRNSDGIHWEPKAVRYMTNLLLTHISIAWSQALPCNLAVQATELINLLEAASKPEEPTDDASAEDLEPPMETDSIGAENKGKESLNLKSIPTIITGSERDERSCSPAKCFHENRKQNSSSDRTDKNIELAGYRGSSSRARRPPNSTRTNNTNRKWDRFVGNAFYDDEDGHSNSSLRRVTHGQYYGNTNHSRGNFHRSGARWNSRGYPQRPNRPLQSNRRPHSNRPQQSNRLPQSNRPPHSIRSPHSNRPLRTRRY